MNIYIGKSWQFYKRKTNTKAVHFWNEISFTSFLSGKHHCMKWYKSVLISLSFKLEETNALCSTVIQWLRVKFTVVSFLLIIVKIPCEIIIPKTIKTVYLYKGEDRFNNKLYIYLYWLEGIQCNFSELCLAFISQ